MTWWLWVLVLVVVVPLLMIGSAAAALALFFLYDLPPRCPGCAERLPLFYRGARYAGDKCPACTVVAAVEATR